MAQATVTRSKEISFYRKAPSAAIPEKAKDGWFYSYGLFNASAMSADTLVVVFTTVVIGASPALISVVDALDTVGAVVSAVIVGRIVDRIRSLRTFLTIAFGMMALFTTLLAVSNDVFVLMAISLLFGFFMGAPGPATALLVTKSTSQVGWAEKFGRLNKIFSLGGGIGLVFGIVWLALVSDIFGASMAMRQLFLLCGLFALIASVLAFVSIKEKENQSLDSIDIIGFLDRFKPARGRFSTVTLMLLPFKLLIAPIKLVLLMPGWIVALIVNIPIWLLQAQKFFREIPNTLEHTLSHSDAMIPQIMYRHGARTHERAKRDDKEPFKESLIVYFASSLVLFLSFGMANTIMPMFVTRHLGAPEFVAVLATTVFVVSATFSYGYISREINYVTPIRTQALAIGLRAVAFVCLGLAGVLIPGLGGIVVMLVLVAVSGVASAALTVAGTMRTALLAPESRRGEALGIHNSVIQAGIIIGTLCGGAIAQQIGYVPVFEIAAGLSVVAMAMLLKL